MSHREIMQQALEAGMPMAWISDSGVLKWTDLERFANLVAEHEREECAKLCDVLAVHPEYASDVTKLAAKAIRTRGNT